MGPPNASAARSNLGSHSVTGISLRIVSMSLAGPSRHLAAMQHFSR